MRKVSIFALLVLFSWVSEASAIRLGGFVDLSYGWNYTGETHEFAFSELELNVSQKWRRKGSFRIDMNYMPLKDQNGNIKAPTMNELIEQMYVTVDLLEKKAG